MLKEQGASLACFRHTYEEICDILHAYKNSLSNSYRVFDQSFHTLEGLDISRCTPARVDRILATLESKIKGLGFAIVAKPEGMDENPGPVNPDLLRKGLESINYGRDKARDRDIESVLAVYRLRRGKSVQSIENCGAVFLTTNAAMHGVVNDLLKGLDDYSVSPVLLDTELGAMLWLKCYSAHGDYPRTKLVEDATLALSPTESIMKSFYLAIEQSKNDGSILPDEYDALRSNLFWKRQLMESIDGNEANISKHTVTSIVESLKNRLRNEDAEALKNAYAERDVLLERQEATKAKALEEIKVAGQNRYNRIHGIGRVAVYMTLMALGFWSIWALVMAFLCDSGGNPIVAASILIVDVSGAIDLFFGKKSLLLHFIDLIAQSSSDRVKDKKRKELEQILGIDV